MISQITENDYVKDIKRLQRFSWSLFWIVMIETGIIAILLTILFRKG